MSVFVVDVSVAVKWMLPEPLATEAARLQSPTHQLHAPSFFEVELANVLWKKVRQGLVSRDQADNLLWPGARLADCATQRQLADCCCV